jgi:hypothetical protein
MAYKPTGGKRGRPKTGLDSHGNPIQQPEAAPEIQPSGPALSAANARRSATVGQLRLALDSLERSWSATIASLLSGGASPAIRQQQQAQYEEGRAATLARLAEAEALTGWALVQRFAPESMPPAGPQADPDAWKAGLQRGAMLPRGQVGAAPVVANPGYLAEYQARMAAQEAEAERQARIKQGNEAIALAALAGQEG